MIDNNDVSDFLQALGETGETIQSLAEKETWVIDNDPIIYEEILKLDKLIPSAYENIDSLLDGSNHDAWLSVLSGMSLPRFILLLQWIMDASNDEFLNLLDSHISTDEHVSVNKLCTFNRLDQLIRIQLLSRIFHPSRIQKITRAIRDKEKTNKE